MVFHNKHAKAAAANGEKSIEAWQQHPRKAATLINSSANRAFLQRKMTSLMGLGRERGKNANDYAAHPMIFPFFLDTE